MKPLHKPVFFLSLSLFIPLSAYSSTLVCLGDSLTAGQGLSEDEAWPAVLEAEFKAAGMEWKVLNAGISGDTSQGGLKRMDWILKSPPAALFVALGANDGLRGIEPFQTKEALSSILRKAKKAGIPCYLAGMQLPTNYGGEFREAFAGMYEEVAKTQGVPLLPFLLKGVGGDPKLNQADGIHPNARGQRRIAKNVFAFLKERLPKAKAGEARPKRGLVRSKKDMQSQ